MPTTNDELVVTSVNAPDGSVMQVRHPSGADEKDILAFAEQQYFSQLQRQNEASAELSAHRDPSLAQKVQSRAKAALGGVEALGNIAAQGLSAPIRGAAAAAVAPVAGPDAAANTFINSGEIVNDIVGPRTEEGKRQLEALTPVLEAADTAVKDVFTGTNPISGRPSQALGLFQGASPIASAAAETLAGGALTVAGTRGRPRAFQGAQALIQRGEAAGFKFDPASVPSAGGVRRATAGLAGRPSLDASISVHNMGNATRLINEDLGIENVTAPITRPGLDEYRKSRSAAHNSIANTGIPIFADREFTSAVRNATDGFDSLIEKFPKLGKDLKQAAASANELLNSGGSFTGSEASALIKTLRENTTKAFRQNKNQAGFAFRELGEALEAAVERSLERGGRPDLVPEMRQARVDISKSYAVQDALPRSGSSGAIDPKRLVSQQAAGKPLTGNLKLIADLADEFPKQFRHAELPTAFNQFDLLAGGVGIVGGQLFDDPLAALSVPALLSLKPVTRALLEGPGQRLNLPRGLERPGSASTIGAAGIASTSGLLDDPSGVRERGLDTPTLESLLAPPLR